MTAMATATTKAAVTVRVGPWESSSTPAAALPAADPPLLAVDTQVLASVGAVLDTVTKSLTNR